MGKFNSQTQPRIVKNTDLNVNDLENMYHYITLGFHSNLITNRIKIKWISHYQIDLDKELYSLFQTSP